MGRKLLLLVLLAACNDKVCARHSDCAPPMTCGATGTCEVQTDAGVDAYAPSDGGADAASDAAVDAP